MQNEENNNVQYFLDLIRRSRRGKFKVYIGMIAGVGKTYRMLQEAHQLLEVGVDVKIGYGGPVSGPPCYSTEEDILQG